MKNVFIIIFMICPAMIFSQGWGNLGDPGFSSGSTTYSSICINTDDTIYAAFNDLGMLSKLRVKKYDGVNWVNLGDSILSDTIVSTAIVKHNSLGELFVAFVDGVTKKACVKKYTGGAWVDVGIPNFSTQIYNGYMDFVISPNDEMYIGYCDYEDLGKGKVMHFNGTNWGGLGGAVSSSGAYYISLAVTSTEVVYMSYQDLSVGQRATVKSFAGSWDLVGIAGFSAEFMQRSSIAVDNSGTPYVAFMEDDLDIGTTNYTKVFKFNGSSWVQQGGDINNGLVEGYYVALEFNSMNQLYLHYSGSSVYKLNGSSWLPIGDYAFVSDITENSIAINSADKVFLIGKNAISGNRVGVFYYCPVNVTSNPPSTKILCIGVPNTISVAVTGTGLTYQWQKKVGTPFVDITDTVAYSGIHTSSLQFNNPIISLDADIYRCKITNECNLSTTSAKCTLDVYLIANVVQVSGVLHATAGDSYSWLDCDNDFTIIPGATGQYFTPSANGNYACVVIKNGCVDTTSCLTVANAALESITSSFGAYPNPANDMVNIRSTEKISFFNVLNNLGQIVLTVPFYNGIIGVLDLSSLVTGSYFIDAKFNDERMRSNPEKIIILR
jgi:hypothetical protein